jgi:UDP-glucose 4-epimerase
MARRVPDVSKLERMIGFRPRTPLAKIIDDVVEYQRSATEVAV